MCGRFSLRARAVEMLAGYFDLMDIPLLAARYNIAPSQPVSVVRLKPTQSRTQRELVHLHWGLIPSWAKDPAIGNRMINARAETLAEKPAFRAPLQRRRCLIAADGFYEWHGTGRSKQPYFIHFRDDRPFAFAGLWESWEGPDQLAMESCTIITTEASELIRPIHDRMPVILTHENFSIWLDPKLQKSQKFTSLLAPYADVEMEAYPVTTLVNSPSHDEPGCIVPENKIIL
jgi:putative SOS response-associated peptidase YedK